MLAAPAGPEAMGWTPVTPSLVVVPPVVPLPPVSLTDPQAKVMDTLVTRLAQPTDQDRYDAALGEALDHDVHRCESALGLGARGAR